MMDFLSTFFDWFRALSLVVSVILFVLVVRLIMLTDSFGGYRKYKLDVYKYGGEEKKRIPDAWKQILLFVKSKNPEDWKKAVIRADKILDDVLKISGYGGATPAERLDHINEMQVLNINQLRVARDEIFSAILSNDALDHAQVKTFLRECRETLRSAGYLQ